LCLEAPQSCSRVCEVVEGSLFTRADAFQLPSGVRRNFAYVGSLVPMTSYGRA